ncbi:hypothetical protein D3C86_1895530 [compost metagenome]
MQAHQDVALHLRGEVDQHIAAKHDVELAQGCITIEQVERTKLHSRADRRLDRPTPRPLGVEVTLQALLGKSPGNGQAIVLATLAIAQH